MNGIYSLQPYIKYNEVLSFVVIKHSKNNRFLENLESSNVKDMDCCCCSVSELYPTLCDPMDCSRQGFSVFHQLLEFAQTHVHWVSDAIQPSCPLSSASPPAFNFPSIRVFSNESALYIRWPKYWSFSFSISPSNKYLGLISSTIDYLILLQSKGLSRVFSNTTVQKLQLFSIQPSLWFNSYIHTWLLEK